MSTKRSVSHLPSPSPPVKTARLCTYQLRYTVHVQYIAGTNTCKITGFRHEEAENGSLLGYYAACSGNFFTDVSGQPIGPIFKGQEITTTLRNNPKEHNSQEQILERN